MATLPWSWDIGGYPTYITGVSVTVQPTPPNLPDEYRGHHFPPFYPTLPKGITGVTLWNQDNEANPLQGYTTVPVGTDAQQLVQGPPGTALAQIVAYGINLNAVWARGMAWQFVFRPITGSGPDTVIRVPAGAPAPPIALPTAGTYVTRITVQVADQQTRPTTEALTSNQPISSLWTAIVAACAGKPSPTHDRAMTTYCAQVSPQDPVCGCVNSAASAPTCMDARCADQPGAYRTVVQTRAPCTGAPIGCEDWAALGDGKYLAKNALPPTGQCGAPPAQIPISNNDMLIVVFLLVVLLSAALISRQYRGSKTGGACDTAGLAWASTLYG